MQQDEPRTDSSGEDQDDVRSAAGTSLSIQDQGILRSVDRDLSFYRSRLYTTYTFIIVVQLLSLVREAHHVSEGDEITARAGEHRR